MRQTLLAAALGAALWPVAAGAAPGDTASAAITGADGASHGTLTLTETPHGVLVTGTLSDLPPGPHGFHVHAVGVCEPPFTSAGGHFNPTDKAHGFHVEGGHHAGDIPNITALEDGTAAVEVLAPGLTLNDGETAALDDDGAALVVHAGPDDYRTDPAGASGDRIACGVISAGT